MSSAATSYAPGVYDILDAVIGDDIVTSFTVQNEDGTPYSLAGSIIRIHLRRADGSLVAAFSDGAGIVLVGNSFEWQIPNSVTKLLSPCNSYFYDIEIEKAGRVRTIIRGRVTFIAEITKP